MIDNNSVRAKDISSSSIVTGNVHGDVIVNSPSSKSISKYDVHQFVNEFKKYIDELPISSETRKVAIADIQSVEAQMNSPKPKNFIIQESLKSIRAILEGITGSAVATGLLSLL